MCSNYLSVELTDIVAALLSVGAIVAFLRVWQPGEPLRAEPRLARPAIAGARGRRRRHEAAVRRREGDGARDSRRDIIVAYAPYVIIIVVFALAQWGPIKDVSPRADGVRLARPGHPQRQGRGADRGDLQVQLPRRRRARCC